MDRRPPGSARTDTLCPDTTLFRDRIPPGRLGARYQWTHGPASADLEYYRTFAQNRVASYETRTEGYDMLNATMSYRLDVGSGKSVERSEEHTSELQSQMRISYAVFCLNNKLTKKDTTTTIQY